MLVVVWSTTDRLSARAPSGVAAPRRGDPVISAIAIGAWLVGSAIWIARKGLFIQTDTVVLWVLSGLFVVTLTDLNRWSKGLILDWLPLGLLLVFYDQSQLLVKALGIGVHTQLQVRFDELLFGKPLLTIQLQHLFGQTSAVRWWEYPMWGLYMTHFFMALVIAGYLWRFSYPRFREFRTKIVILSTLGFGTYVLFPAAPPWYLADHLSQLPWIQRTVFQTWGQLGLHTARSLVDGPIAGNDLGNQLAAVPSMHAAISLFVACFFWRRAALWLRVILVIYVLGMAFTLVYSGEHYVFDIVVGWGYTVLVLVGAKLLARWRSRSGAGVVSAQDRAPALGEPLRAARVK
jgi:membrane-associated phospholipid phosphatase